MENPVEEPKTGACGDDGVPPVAELSTIAIATLPAHHLCTSNVANFSQEHIDSLSKDCGH